MKLTNHDAVPIYHFIISPNTEEKKTSNMVLREVNIPRTWRHLFLTEQSRRSRQRSRVLSANLHLVDLPRLHLHSSLSNYDVLRAASWTLISDHTVMKTRPETQVDTDFYCPAAERKNSRGEKSAGRKSSVTLQLCCGGESETPWKPSWVWLLKRSSFPGTKTLIYVNSWYKTKTYRGMTVSASLSHNCRSRGDFYTFLMLRKSGSVNWCAAEAHSQLNGYALQRFRNALWTNYWG